MAFVERVTSRSIRYGATISAPHMVRCVSPPCLYTTHGCVQHAHAAENLLPFLNKGARVLDVGSGSGYLCAIFHHLIQKDDDDTPTGKVVGIEHIPELADWSISNLKKDGLESSLSSKQIEVHAGDGRLGIDSI
jgi:protein-L-isoaspartate(D-aspartate) O-methyltransferase